MKGARSIRVLMVVLGAMMPGACSDDDADSSSVCEPGATQACLCVGDLDGVQSCKQDASGWAPCTCGAGGGTTVGGGGGAGGGGGGGGAGEPLCTDPVEVPCSDQVILGLDLQADIAPGLIENTSEGDGWRSKIDATAGGFAAPDPDSYVHAVFTDGGLTKTDISDEDSLDSMDWDIGFRRYIIRINSGNSGPSCVRAATLAGPPSYDDLTEVPANIEALLEHDEYFDQSCGLIEDNSGLGAPDTAMSGFWEYTVCVSMTGRLYIIELRNGRRLKLEVTHYYDDAAQEQCNSGTAPGSPNGSANIKIRWAFLP